MTGRSKDMTAKKKSFVAYLLLLTFFLAGCGGSPSSGNAGTSGGNGSAASVPEYKRELNVAVAQEAPSFDLHKNTTLMARLMMAGTLWEKIITLNAQSEVIPELAESYEVSPDATEYVFYLRKGVKFHDGSEMMANDVVASLNRWIESFATARTLVGNSRFVQVDDYTVRITFAQPIITFADILAGASQAAIITTEEATKNEDSNGFMKDFIGTGPFKFSEWKLNQYTLLERFEDYTPYGEPSKPVDGWAGYKNPQIDKLYFYYVTEESTRVAGLETGQFDVNYNVLSDSISHIERIDGVTFFRNQTGTLALIFNKKEGLGTNQYLRQAVNAALDSEELMMSYAGELFALGSSYMEDSQAFWVSHAGAENYNQKNPEKAKEFLEKAGYDGKPFTILASTLNGFDRTAIVVKYALESIGMKVDLVIVDWATFTKYRNMPSMYDMYVTAFSSVPVPTLKLYFSPNYAGWTEDPKLQEYITKINTSSSRETARQVWEELQGYVWESLPVIHLGYYSNAYAWSDKVSGLNTYNGLFFWTVKVEK